jgi:pilus assembly protein CpaF
MISSIELRAVPPNLAAKSAPPSPLEAKATATLGNQSSLNQIVAAALATLAEQPYGKHLPVHEGQWQGTDTHFARRIEGHLVGLSPEVKLRVTEEVLGWGPIAQLLDDPSLTEIVINSPEQIWVERHGRWLQHHDRFFSELTYRNFLHRLARDSGAKVDFRKPYADGRWRDFRVHRVAPPIAQGQGQLSLRRVRNQAWTLQDLFAHDWVPERDRIAVHSALTRLVREHQNVLIFGGTSSGKTSVLGALLAEAKGDERMLILEDADEITPPNPLSVKLLAKEQSLDDELKIPLEALLRQSLRMRPDRIILGEVRGGEAKDLLMALSTGHCGSWGTLHARTAQEGLMRLEMLVQMGAPQWSNSTVRQLIAQSVQALIQLSRDENGKRRLDAIHRIASLEDRGFCLTSIYQRSS